MKPLTSLTRIVNNKAIAKLFPTAGYDEDTKKDRCTFDCDLYYLCREPNGKEDPLSPMTQHYPILEYLRVWVDATLFPPNSDNTVRCIAV